MLSEPLHRLLDLLPEAMLLVQDGRIVMANRSAGVELGLDPDVVRDKNLADFVADREPLDKFLRTCSRNLSMSLGAFTVCGSRGEIICRAEGGLLPGEKLIVLRLRPREVAATRFLTLNRKIDELTGEIARRTAAERHLRESEHKFQQLADSMPQFVWMARPDGTIDYYNRQWHEFTGIEDISNGTEIAALTVHPEDLETCLSAWHHSVTTGDAFTMEYRFRKPGDEHYKWFLGRALAVTEDGRVVRWFGTSTDIDAHKRALQSVEQLSRRKDEFLAMLAHELRNPLAPIRNAAAILTSTPDTGAAVQRVGAMIERQVNHLSRLVDDLLDVARFTSGKIRLKKSPILLETPLLQAIDNIRELAELHRQKLEIELPDAPIALEADPVRLTQAFTNLLNNAVKYSDHPGTIRVRVLREEAEAQISIEDSGIGMDETLLPQVFDLFTQGDRALDRSQGGLGIGLTLVKTLVSMHGGSVEASSPGLGCGSRFLLRLPSKPSGAESFHKSANLASSTPNPSLKILIVDDNKDAADSIAALLGAWGLETTVVYAGSEALQRAESDLPDVILLDIGLPTISGLEVAQRLRSGGNGAVLVALTGYGEQTSVQAGFDAGFDHYLIKPVSPESLRSVLCAL